MHTSLARIAPSTPPAARDAIAPAIRLSHDADAPVPAAVHALQDLLAATFEADAAAPPAKFAPAARLAILAGGTIGAWAMVFAFVAAVR